MSADLARIQSACALSGSPCLPQDLLPREAVVVFSSRFELQEKVLQGVVSDLVLPQIRCPFSAGAGDPHVHYDDNGWIFATRASAMSRILRHAPSPSTLRENGKGKVGVSQN